MDVVVVGQVARDLALQVDAVPEAGGTAAVHERIEMLGGKGANQAVGMAQLGLAPVLVGVVGDDPAGSDVLAQAEADGIGVGAAVRRAGARTGLIVDVVDGSAHRRYLEDLPPGGAADGRRRRRGRRSDRRRTRRGRPAPAAARRRLRRRRPRP